MKKKKKRPKVRKKWQINPASRVKESEKIYSRLRERKRLKKELKNET